MSAIQSLTRAVSPEKVGVNSDIVYEFMKELKLKKLNLHSFMILRHGSVAAECCKYPYKRSTPMAMFSFSKGITSTAIGFAIQEKRMALSDKICSYFPYKCKTKRDRNRFDKVTVFDLLTHQSGKFIPPVYDSEKRRWDDLWLSAPFTDEPGSKFSYISENTYMLAKILKKVTGNTIEDYLTPRLFEPLGIQTPYWEADHDGCSAGGWGAFMTLEDIAKIGQFYLQKGRWGNRQLLATSWIDLATTSHVKNIPSSFLSHIDYGFQLFVQPEMKTYSFNGLYGQYVVVFPEYDAVIAYTSGDCNEYSFMETLYKYFPKAFTADAPNGHAEKLVDYIYSFEHPITSMGIRSKSTEQAIDGRVIQINRTRPYASVICPSTTFMQSAKAGKMNGIKLHFDKDNVIMRFTENKCSEQTIIASTTEKYAYSKIQIGGGCYETAAKATWLKPNCLKFDIIPLESAQKRTLIFKFRKKNVRILTASEPKFDQLFKFYLMFNGVKQTKPLTPGIKLAGAVADRIFNPNMTGVLM